MNQVQHIAGHTFHGRKGDIANAFRYRVDYVLLDMDKTGAKPSLFSRNARNVTAVFDCDHGGAPKAGHGVKWVRRGAQCERGRVEWHDPPFDPTTCVWSCV